MSHEVVIIAPSGRKTLGIDELPLQIGSSPAADLRLPGAVTEKAVALILGSLLRAFDKGKDRDAREQMALGSLLAGLAFAVPKTAAVHACSFPLTQLFGLSHGVACAFTLDAFVRYNAEQIPEKLGRLAQTAGLDGPSALAERGSRPSSRACRPPRHSARQSAPERSTEAHRLATQEPARSTQAQLPAGALRSRPAGRMGSRPPTRRCR